MLLNLTSLSQLLICLITSKSYIYDVEVNCPRFLVSSQYYTSEVTVADVVGWLHTWWWSKLVTSCRPTLYQLKLAVLQGKLIKQYLDYK